MNFVADDLVPTGPELQPGPVADLGAGRGPEWLDQWLRGHLDQALAWRRSIHAHPELLREEFRTTALIADVLRSLGLQPRILPIETGVICEIGSGPRCIALRADIDALPINENSELPFRSQVPGVAHACGHDMHTAILLGAAAALASAPELPGRVRVLFQPAEEEPGGAHDMITSGGVDGVERIFGLHCDPKIEVGQVGTRVGPLTSATNLLDVHVSAAPDRPQHADGGSDVIHALGAVATGLPAVLARQVDPYSGTVLAWGVMDAAEGVSGENAARGILRGTLRTADPKTNERLHEQVEEALNWLLSPIGVHHELDYFKAVPVVDNDAESTAIMRNGIAAALGPEMITSTPQSSGGEDFGWYLDHVPGSYARLGVWSGEGPQCDLHQPTFQADEKALPAGIRVMVHTALAALTDPPPN